MNKYQKALNHYDWHVPIRSVEQFKTLQELVDKETPMKPMDGVLTQVFLNSGVDEQTDVWICPNCNNFVGHKEDDNDSSRCYECGQRIDWSIDDE